MDSIYTSKLVNTFVPIIWFYFFMEYRCGLKSIVVGNWDRCLTGMSIYVTGAVRSEITFRCDSCCIELSGWSGS